MGSKRKLLVLDLNGVLWDTLRYKNNVPSRDLQQLQQNGNGPRMHWGQSYGCVYVYTERPGLRLFLEYAFAYFDVGIWTCAGIVRATHMMSLLFDEETRGRFKFIYTQEFTRDSHIQRPDITSGKANILFKDLRRVWSKFEDLYDVTNTILVDDSPAKSFVNPEHTTLYVPQYRATNKNNDAFLLEILWPYLSKVEQACDVHQFMKMNTPKWSIVNHADFTSRNNPIWCQLVYHWERERCQATTRFTILDFTSEEIAWDIKEWVENSVGIEDMSDEQIQHVGNSWLTEEYVTGPCRDNPRLFVAEVLKMKDTTQKFKNHSLSRNACRRDDIRDINGDRLTCTNEFCTNEFCKYELLSDVESA